LKIVACHISLIDVIVSDAAVILIVSGLSTNRARGQA
jgi:hypothetical protein